MEELDVLMSDEFTEFSQQIAEIARHRKALKEEFEATYAAFKVNMKNFEKDVLKAKKDFETWKAKKDKG